MSEYKCCDVAIIGGGIGGLMAAYRLIEKKPSLKITLIEKGPDLKHRVCPMVTGSARSCIHCRHCSIMEGLAGAGAFSDGKYVISTEYGGWLTDYLPQKQVIDYIEQADAVLVNFGATTDRYMPSDALKKRCLQHDLHMHQAQLKHLGTDSNFETMLKLIDSLRDRVEIITETEVTDVDRENHRLTLKRRGGNEQTLEAEHIIFAVGRVGSRFFSEWCRKNRVTLINNQIDIGVRLGMAGFLFTDLRAENLVPL